MAQIEVSEKLTAELQLIAQRDDRALQEVLAEAIDSYLHFRSVEPQLTPVQIEAIRQSLMEAERGELVSQEEVEAFFEDWEKEITAR